MSELLYFLSNKCHGPHRSPEKRRRKFFNFVYEFSVHCNHLPLEKGVILNLKFKSSLSKMLCAKFGWIWRSGSGEEDCQISSIYFRSFVIITLKKGVARSFEQTWISLHPTMLCAKFCWNCTHGSGEEDENVKSLRTDTQTTDDRRSEKLTGAFSSGELKYTACVCSSSHLCIFWFFERARKII